MGDRTVHKRPAVDEDVLPCCGQPVNPDALMSVNDDQVTCEGSDPTAGKRVDYDIKDETYTWRPDGPQFDWDAAKAAMAEPTGRPTHGEPGHECITDGDMLEIGSILGKVGVLAQAHRERLLRLGFDETTAQALAAHTHTVLVRGLFGS